MSTSSVIIDKWTARSILLKRPLQASLELTNRCNERCTHCYIPAFKDDPERVLKLDHWISILDQLREAGTLYLVLMGGEAMLSPYFWDIAKHASHRGFWTSMITNGQKIKDFGVAEKLKASGMQHITVSFYSMHPEIHDSMTTVPGSWAKTKQAIEWCLEAGIQVGINCLLTRANISHHWDLEDWCRERKLELKIDPTITPKLNGDLSPTNFRPTKEQLRKFYLEFAQRWKNGLPVSSIDSGSDHICNAGKGKCAITAYGELLPCIEVRKPMGSLVTERFSEIWARHSEVREMKNSDIENLPKEDHGKFCDHCPGMAGHEHGNMKRVTDYTVLLAKIKSEVRREVLGSAQKTP